MTTCNLPRIWQEEFKIHSYEMGPSGYASPQAICRFLQEAASNHATKLGFTATEMERLDQMWVLSQLSLRMQEYPRGQETLHIETWPVSNQSSIRGFRDFILKNSKNEIIGCASTMWLLLSKESRRPLRIPAGLSELCSPGHYSATMHPPTEADFDRDPETVQEFAIRASDIDWNMHVNNVCYLEWSLEAVPAIFRLKHKIVELDIAFLQEGKYGGSVLAECLRPQKEAAQHYLHRIKDKENGKILAQMRMRWEPKDSMA